MEATLDPREALGYVLEVDLTADELARLTSDGLLQLDLADPIRLPAGVEDAATPPEVFAVRVTAATD